MEPEIDAQVKPRDVENGADEWPQGCEDNGVQRNYRRRPSLDMAVAKRNSMREELAADQTKREANEDNKRWFKFRLPSIWEQGTDIDLRGTNYSSNSIVAQVDIIKAGLDKRRYLIDPQSDYMKYWDIVIIASLLFTAVSAPYEIAFLETNYYSPFYYLSRVLDIIFFKDMLMQFIMKTKVETPHGSIWLRSRKALACRYFRSWFVVDFLSILPYDDLPRLVPRLSGNTSKNLKMLRLLRVLRILKLTRMLRGNRIITRHQNKIGLKYSTLHMLRFCFLIVVSCHWLACAWAFVGLFEGTNLKCRKDLPSDDPRLETSDGYFIENQDGNGKDPRTWSGQSWIVVWASERAVGAPMDPCDHFSVYLASLYWTVMTLTSIGYGDILPVTYSEYILCILMMMLASIIWAYVIACATAVATNGDPEQMEFEQRLDAFNSMASDKRLPTNLRRRGRDYIREARYHTHKMRGKQVVENLGSDLWGCIARNTAVHYLSNIWFFAPTGQLFKEAVSNNLKPNFFERTEVIDLVGNLCIVEHGAVGVGGRVLVPWQFWGADCLVCKVSLRDRRSVVAMSFCEVMALSREALNKILQEYPEEIPLMRRTAGWMAFKRGIKIMALAQLSGEYDPEFDWLYNVFETARETADAARISHISVASSQGAEVTQVGVAQKSQDEMLSVVYEYIMAQKTLVDAENRSTPPLSRQNSSHSLTRQDSTHSLQTKRQPMMASEFEVLRSQLGRIEGAIGVSAGCLDNGSPNEPSAKKCVSEDARQAQLDRIEMRLNAYEKLSGGGQSYLPPPPTFEKSAFEFDSQPKRQVTPCLAPWQALPQEANSTVSKMPALLALPRGDGTPLPASCTWACSAPAVAGDPRYPLPHQAQSLVPLTEARADSRPQPPKSVIEASPRGAYGRPFSPERQRSN